MQYNGRVVCGDYCDNFYMNIYKHLSVMLLYCRGFHSHEPNSDLEVFYIEKSRNSLENWKHENTITVMQAR